MFDEDSQLAVAIESAWEWFDVILLEIVWKWSVIIQVKKNKKSKGGDDESRLEMSFMAGGGDS